MPAQPQNTPIVSKPTPIVLDELLIETTDSNKALYDRQLEYGHLYPDQIRYPGFKFLAAKPNSYGQMQYIWGNGFTSQDSYNAAKDYDKNANSYPVFVRSYRVLRSDYLVNGPLTKRQPFTGIAAISVTAGGSGYTDDFAASFTGGAGSGAAATAIVSNGAVVRVELTNVGTGYTSAPTIGFAAGSGTAAAATAIIQPVTALLIEEHHTKLPDDDPYTSLYDKVTRVYKTLPGPELNGLEMNDNCQGELAVTSVQELLYSDAAYTPDFQTLNYSDTPIDANQKLRRVTTAQAFPILYDRYYDAENNYGLVVVSYVVVASSTSLPALGTGTTAELRHIDKWRSLLIQKTYSVPAAELQEYRFGAWGMPGLFDDTVATGVYFWSDACGAFATCRTARSMMTDIYTKTQWFTSDPGPTAGKFVWFGNFQLLGRGWQLPQDLLMDARSFAYTGACTATVDILASTPTYSSYIGTYQNTSQFVAEEITYGKNRLWKRVKLYVKML